MSHRLQLLTARLIQNGRRGLEIGQSLGYWTLRSLKKFFYLIIPSMRTSKIQEDHQGPQNGQWGLARGQPIGFWALLSTFAN